MNIDKEKLFIIIKKTPKRLKPLNKTGRKRTPLLFNRHPSL